MKHHRDLVIELSDDEATKNMDDNVSDCIIDLYSCEEEKRDNTVCEKKVGSIYNAVARRCNEYSSDSKRFRTLLNSSSQLKKDDDHYESDVLFARQLHENEKKSHNRENVEAIRYTKCGCEEKNSVWFDEDIDYSAPVPMTKNQYDDDDSVIARFLQEEEEKMNKHYARQHASVRVLYFHEWFNCEEAFLIETYQRSMLNIICCDTSCWCTRNRYNCCSLTMSWPPS